MVYTDGMVLRNGMNAYLDLQKITDNRNTPPHAHTFRLTNPFSSIRPLFRETKLLFRFLFKPQPLLLFTSGGPLIYVPLHFPAHTARLTGLRSIMGLGSQRENSTLSSNK